MWKPEKRELSSKLSGENSRFLFLADPSKSLNLPLQVTPHNANDFSTLWANILYALSGHWKIFPVFVIFFPLLFMNSPFLPRLSKNGPGPFSKRHFGLAWITIIQTIVCERFLPRKISNNQSKRALREERNNTLAKNCRSNESSAKTCPWAKKTSEFKGPPCDKLFKRIIPCGVMMPCSAN